MNKSGLVTVVLPTKNEAHNVSRLLASLPADIPLIVLDDSEDGTQEIVRGIRPRFTHIIPFAGGVAQKRQFGAQLAETEWVLFTDADIQFTPDYFQNVKHYLQKDLVFGPKLTAGGHEVYYKVFSMGQSIASRLGIPSASASNMIVRRRALMGVGGFDTNLPCNEDTDLAFRLVNAGYKYQWAPALAVYNTDHRRLRRGIGWRYAHMLVRSFLVFISLRYPFLRRWLYVDWGYW